MTTVRADPTPSTGFLAVSSTRPPRRLISVRAIAHDPQHHHPDEEVLVTVETTDNEHLVVGPCPIRLGTSECGFADRFVVIHVPTGLAVLSDQTASLEAARAFADCLADTNVDWSQPHLSDGDDKLRAAIIEALATFWHRHSDLTHVGST
jgi:hypothetical protein